MRNLSLAVFLCIFWLASSGRVEPLYLGMMMVSCAAVVALARRLRVVDAEGHPVELLFGMCGFAAWLVVRIVEANLAVVRLVLARRPELAPGVVRVAATQSDDLGRTIHANSVTMTPGTVTLEVRDDSLLVHSLVAGEETMACAAQLDRRVSAALIGTRP